LLCIALLAISGIGANVVFALPPQPIDPDPVGEPEPFVVPDNGFEWSMPARFGNFANGMVDYHWNESTATYGQDYVNPAGWTVNFDGCRTDADEISGTSALTYTWTLKGETRINHICRFQEPFAAQGANAVNLTIQNSDGSVVFDSAGRGNPFTQNVVVKDLLVVSLGDSYASGEGSPDVPQALGNYDIF